MKTRKFTTTLFIISFIFINSKVFSQYNSGDQTHKFPPTEKVAFLLKKPDQPFIIIDTIETRGKPNSVLRELFVELIEKAKLIGADAIIPTKTLDGEEASNSINKLYVIGYQHLPNGKAAILRGYAIKYKENVIKLLDNGLKVNVSAKSFSWGIQSDIFPYFLNGYDLSCWIGKNNMRLNMNIFKLITPDFYLKDGFENNKIELARALSFDYFFNEGFEGLWLSNSIESWNRSLRHKLEEEFSRFKNLIYAVGVGYNYKLFNNMVVGGKTSLAFIIGGSSDITVGKRQATFHKIAPRISINIGMNF